MKNPKIKTICLVFTLIFTLGVMFSAGCVSVTQGTDNPTNTTTASLITTAINPTWTPPTTNVATGQLPNIADVVAMVKPSVVAINTEVISYDFFNRPYTQQGAGSGWIIDANGIIVTNNHVVEGAETITVTTDNGESYEADISSVSTDPFTDLAIIKIEASNLPVLKTGSAVNMRVGDWVIAIGNALGQGIRATEGIISRQGVSLPVDQDQSLYDLIETSAAINPGNSGGPLVNLAGEVIGITSAKIASVGIEGMGYAISIDTAMPIIEELVTKGYVTRPWLGVRLYTVDQIAIAQLDLNIDTGVLITQVVSGSPAENAGLKQWDVIVSIDGIEVANIEELTEVLHATTIGEPIELKYWRGNAEYTTSVTPAESPRP